jgi:hypothetical protein
MRFWRTNRESPSQEACGKMKAWPLVGKLLDTVEVILQIQGPCSAIVGFVKEISIVVGINHERKSKTGGNYLHRGAFREKTW